MIQPEWVAIGLIAGSQVVQFIRNGSATRKAIHERLNQTEVKFTKEISDMKEVCAGARATFTNRLDNHDRELRDIKKP